jgi:RNA polymerase sigma factor (sigma-70 family)
MDSLTLLVESQLPAAARGDREAFARLVDGTRALVSSIALAIVRDAELSRDISQDVFLAAWRDLSQLRDPGSFLPWLRQITRHRAYHVLRTTRRGARRITDADVDALLESAADPQAPADVRLAAEEERAALTTVLDELPDETREVVTLFYREGQSTAQVATLLGLSEAAVRKRLSRARNRLRESLLAQFGDAVRRAAPGAGFTSVVMTAIAVGAPAQASAASAATAAQVTVGAAGGGIGASVLSKIVALGGAVMLPAAGGLTGVLFGTRQLKRQARSAAELRGLRRFEAVSAALVVLTAAAFPVSWIATGSDWSPVVTFGTFVAGLVALHHVWLPRILAPRFAMEMAEDPTRARAARARERRIAWLGWTLGLVSGTAGLIAGIWMT